MSEIETLSLPEKVERLAYFALPVDTIAAFVGISPSDLSEAIKFDADGDLAKSYRRGVAKLELEMSSATINLAKQGDADAFDKVQELRSRQKLSEDA